MSDPKDILKKKMSGKQAALTPVPGKSNLDVGIRIYYDRSGWVLDYFRYIYEIDRSDAAGTPNMRYTKIYEAGDKNPFETFEHRGQGIKQEFFSEVVRMVKSYNQRLDSVIEASFQADLVLKTIKSLISGLSVTKEQYKDSVHGKNIVDTIYSEYGIKMNKPYIEK